jgi:hypothetical protein
MSYVRYLTALVPRMASVLLTLVRFEITTGMLRNNQEKSLRLILGDAFLQARLLQLARSGLDVYIGS